MMLERGLNDDTVNALKAMMNPTVVGLLEATGGDLRQMIIDKVTPSLTAGLLQNVEEVEVFQQTRSIVSSVQRLYEVGSPVPATLILLFSVVVPFVKTALVGWAMFMAPDDATADAGVRRSHCQVVDGRRLRRRAVHHLSRGHGEPEHADRRSAGRGLYGAVRRPASTGSPPTACSRWRRSSSPRACSPRACEFTSRASLSPRREADTCHPLPRTRRGPCSRPRRSSASTGC